MNTRKLTDWLLWAALGLALLGSLRHVAWTFTSIDGNAWWGLVQAIAVDIGLLALAIGIQQRRHPRVRGGRGERAGWLWFGVVLFSLISIYANLAYGLRFTLGELPVWIARSRPWVLAATLPVLVLYLAEIVGSGSQASDRQPATSGAELTINDIEPATSDTYLCDFPGCGRSFGSQQGLNAHQRTHQSNEPAANGREPGPGRARGA